MLLRPDRADLMSYAAVLVRFSSQAGNEPAVRTRLFAKQFARCPLSHDCE